MNAVRPTGATKARVTQADIARVAGVHPTTVSLVLRDGPGISDATRKRIRMIAEQMGFYPDPMLRALVEYRNSLRPRRPERTLAYLTNWGMRWGWRAAPGQAAYRAGALRRAVQLGFRFEDFCLNDTGTKPRDLGRLLADRGATCVVLASHRAGGEDPPEIDWERFSAVTIGRFPAEPALHRVVDDPGGTVRLALRQAQAAGYERIGLVLAPWWDDLADQAWSTGFLAEQSRQAVRQRVPILRYDGESDAAGADDPRGRTGEASALARWYDEYRPDAVLAYSPAAAARLRGLGLSIPADVAYVDLALGDDDAGCAGVRQHGVRAGEIAVELAFALAQQNLRGLPAVPTVTSVGGVWVDGATLPAPRPPPALAPPRREPVAEPALTVLV